jgi:hypothetical protein
MAARSQRETLGALGLDPPPFCVVPSSTSKSSPDYSWGAVARARRWLSWWANVGVRTGAVLVSTAARSEPRELAVGRVGGERRAPMPPSPGAGGWVAAL